MIWYLTGDSEKESGESKKESAVSERKFDKVKTDPKIDQKSKFVNWWTFIFRKKKFPVLI